MVGSKTYRPVFYCILPENINDRASFRRFLSTLDDSLGNDGYKIVMDEGFCNKANITLMYDMKLKFTISLTKSLSFTSDAIDEAADTIESFSNYHQIIGSNVFLTTSLKDWGGHRCYTHVYYDETKRYNDRKRFMDRLDKCRALLEKNETLPEFEVPFAEIYFTIDETPKRGSKVIPNENIIREYRNRRAGFLVLISNHENDPVKALEIYRCKETAELSFDDMKNNQDFNRLRVATEQAMDGRAFIQFVALCISLELKHVIYSNDDLKNRTEREIIDEMKLLRATKIEGRHNPIRTELTKLHKLVLKAFLIPEYADIEMPAADEPQIGPDD